MWGEKNLKCRKLALISSQRIYLFSFCFIDIVLVIIYNIAWVIKYVFVVMI